MNVFGTQTTTDNSPQKINGKFDFSNVDLNIGSKTGYDKLTFDSLFTNLKAEKIERTQSQYNEYRAQDANRNSKDTERNSSVDNRSDRNRSDEINRGRKETERSTDTDNKNNQEYRSEDLNERPDYNKAKARVEEKDNTKATQEQGDEVPQEDATIEESTANTVKINALLSELSNGSIVNADATEAPEIKINAGESQGSQKKGDLLTQLLQGTVEESVQNKLSSGQPTETSVKGAQSDTGLKNEDILAALISGKAEDNKKSDQNNAKHNDNSKAGNIESVKIENSMMSAEKSDKSPEMKMPGMNEEILKTQKMSENPDTSEAEVEELINRIHSNGTDKKAEIKQEHIKEAKIQEYMEAKYIQENSNVKIAVNKINPGIVENLIRESGIRTNTNIVPKAGHAESDSSNLEILSGVDVKSEGGKANSPLTPVTVSRPSGFSEVVNKVIYVAKGENTLGVTIDHKELGKINIKLSLEKGMVNVHINTADKAAREFVESNMQQIVESLSKNGVSVGGFSVGLKNHQNGKGFENAHSSRNERKYSVNSVHEKEYVKAATNVYAGRGRVSILA